MSSKPVEKVSDAVVVSSSSMMSSVSSFVSSHKMELLVFGFFLLALVSYGLYTHCKNTCGSKETPEPSEKSKLSKLMDKVLDAKEDPVSTEVDVSAD